MTIALADVDAWVATIADRVLAVLLTGSLAREGSAGRDSDADLIVVVSDDASLDFDPPSGIDVAVYRLGRLRRVASPHSDPDDWWNRYAFAHVRVLIDNLPGSELGRLIDAQATLSEEETAAIAVELLDGYLNYAYRSRKSARDGNGFESRLDAAESIPWALGTLFALEGRVRPYNKYLRWALDRLPLESIDSRTLMRFIDEIRVSGDPAVQRELARAIVAAARARGYSEVVDAWGDSLDLITR